MKKYYVYILSGQDYGPLFIETTSNLSGRMKSHRFGHLSQSAFRIDRLVYFETFDTSLDAQLRLKALRSASREWVDALVERKNPNWTDIFKTDDQAPRRVA